MEIAKGMSADKAAILREGYIALENTSSHTGASHGAFDGFLWEL